MLERLRRSYRRALMLSVMRCFFCLFIAVCRLPSGVESQACLCLRNGRRRCEQSSALCRAEQLQCNAAPPAAVFCSPCAKLLCSADELCPSSCYLHFLWPSHAFCSRDPTGNTDFSSYNAPPRPVLSPPPHLPPTSNELVSSCTDSSYITATWSSTVK